VRDGGATRHIADERGTAHLLLVRQVLHLFPELAQKRVQERIQTRVGVDPLWVRADRRTAELYRIGNEVGFGRAEAYRCPYYIRESGSCSVWLHREAVCSTWYCKFNKPIKGREFWGALKLLLLQLENVVSVHCALEKGISSQVLDGLLSPENTFRTANDVDARPDDAQQARLWGKWLGREEQFYAEVSQLAEQIELDDIRKLAGLSLQRRLDPVVRGYEALMSNTLPDRLRAASKLVVSTAGPGSVHIQAGPFQPVELPAPVIELLTHFRGQPVSEAVASLAENGFEVETEFLKKLFDSGFLMSADSMETGSA
jgi:hypothetical protein